MKNCAAFDRVLLSYHTRMIEEHSVASQMSGAEMFAKLYPKLAPNGVIVADNMLFPEVYREAAAVYRNAVRSKPDMQAVLLPIGQGIDISCRNAGSRT